MTNKTETVKRFFHLLQWFTTTENEYKSILHPAIEQTEYPNLMIHSIRKRTFTNFIEGAEAGKKCWPTSILSPSSFLKPVIQ